MTTITTRTLQALILPFLMINLTTISMDYPQLQLQEKTNTKKEIIIHSAKLCIKPHTSRYAPKEVHWAIYKTHGFQSSPKDPVISVEIKYDIEIKDGESTATIPVKYLFNHNTESIITFSTLFPYKHTIHAVCIKNPLLDGNSFAEQYNAAMKNFYKKPFFVKKYAQEFIDAGIIIKETNSRNFAIIFRIADGTLLAVGAHTESTYKHGPNGCQNEKRFVESMAAKQTKPYNNSMYQLAMQRQYGKPLRQSKKTSAQDIKPLNEALIPSYQTEYGRHCNECTLF